MIRDNETTIVAATDLDLEAVRPGPGEPIRVWLVDDTAEAITVSHGDAVGTEATLLVLTVAADEITELELPSSTKRYVRFTPAAGTIDGGVSLAGVQTNR